MVQAFSRDSGKVGDQVGHGGEEEMKNWQVQIRKPYIEMRKPQHWQPKHDKEVKWVPMSVAVQEILKRRQAKYKDGLLFRYAAGKEARGDKTREALQKMFSKVNIDSTTQRLHWHSFRAFFVRKCVRKGIPINAIMRMTGHDTIGLVLHYADADKAAVLQETDKLFAPCGKICGSHFEPVTKTPHLLGFSIEIVVEVGRVELPS